MRGKKLVTSIVLASALTVPFLMPTGAQAQLIGPLDLGNVLGQANSPFAGGGLLGTGGIGSEGGLLNSLLRDAVLLNNCGLPLLSGGCRAFSDDFEVNDVDTDTRFRRSNVFIVDDGHGRRHDGRRHDGRRHDGRDHRCFIEPWLCGHDGKRFHDGRHDGRHHDGRFFDDDDCCFHNDPFVVRHAPVVHTVPVGGQNIVNNNNNNNNLIAGGGGGASSSASSSSSSSG